MKSTLTDEQKFEIRCDILKDAAKDHPMFVIDQAAAIIDFALNDDMRDVAWTLAVAFGIFEQWEKRTEGEVVQ